MKRKATDTLPKTKGPKKANKAASTTAGGPSVVDESSSSSSTSTAVATSKSTKTAAVIAAAQAATAAAAAASNSASSSYASSSNVAMNSMNGKRTSDVKPHTASSSSSSSSSSATSAPASAGVAGVSEEEVRRYLSRKPMTTKELFHKFRSKTQTSLSKEELFQALKDILDKLKCKMIEQNGNNYLVLP